MVATVSASEEGDENLTPRKGDAAPSLVFQIRRSRLIAPSTRSTQSVIGRQKAGDTTKNSIVENRARFCVTFSPHQRLKSDWINDDEVPLGGRLPIGTLYCPE